MEKLLSLIAKNNLTLEQKARYMDDIRLWMYSIRLGWRWVDGGLKYSTEWRTEERMAGMTGLQKTVEVIKHMMNSICDFLVLTMESGDDFPGGRLPTLDLNIWVGEDNVTRYIFFEKPMASSMVIQRRSAMPENMRVSTLTQEVIRRMMNTSEKLEQSERNEVIDVYGKKLVNSGYSLDQSIKFIIVD